MLKRTSKILNNAGILLCVIGIATALNLFIFSLPGIGFGTWPQSELAIGILHFSSALCSAGLLILGAGKNGYIIRRIAVHPFVFLPLIIALLSLLFMFLYELPVRHFLGSSRTGEGVAWWFDWAALSASCLFLCRFGFFRRALIFIALASFAVTYALCISHEYFGYYYTPYYYADFLAFNVFCLIPVIAYAAGMIPGSPAKWLIMYLITGALVFLTHNNVAIAYTIAGFGFFLLLWAVLSQPSYARIKSGIATLSIMLVPILVFAGIFIILNLSGNDGYYEFQQSQIFRTIVSRAYLINVALSPVAENPLSLVTGSGWGTFTEQIAGHLPIKWLDFTKEGSAQWDGLTTDHFHSHNMLVETFFSSGIINALALYTLIISIPFFSSGKKQLPALIFAGSLASLASFWFLLPLNLPFIALALGFCGSFNKRFFNLPVATKAILIIICTIALSAQVIAGAMTISTAASASRYVPQELQISKQMQQCPMEYVDYGAGGLHLSKMMINRMRFALYTSEDLDDKEGSEKEEAINSIKRELKRVNHLFCQSTIYKKNYNMSRRLAVARLIMRGEILLGLENYIDENSIEFYLKNWKGELLEWLEDVPLRTDQAIPYLMWNLVHSHEIEVKEVSLHMYAINPNDPVALWFSGLVMAGEPGSVALKGIRRMRRALSLGIERYMPIDLEIKKQLLAPIEPRIRTY